MALEINAVITVAGVLVIGAIGCGSAAESAAAAPAVAEAQSYCSGVADEDRDRDPFADCALIESVGELKDREQHGKVWVDHVRGAEIALRATPGMSTPWLERMLRCHEARLQTTALADRERDPLAVDHPTVLVSEQETRFVVAIRGSTNEDAREIVRRARALQARQ